MTVFLKGEGGSVLATSVSCDPHSVSLSFLTECLGETGSLMKSSGVRSDCQPAPETRAQAAPFSTSATAAYRLDCHSTPL